jgi:hypothetical protein
MSLETRKAITDLTPADLGAFAVWEFALDEEGVEGQDETWVRPLNKPVVLRNRYSLIVATEFRAVCGRIYPGFCIVTTAGQEVEIGAGVVLHGRITFLPTIGRSCSNAQGWLRPSCSQSLTGSAFPSRESNFVEVEP